MRPFFPKYAPSSTPSSSSILRENESHRDDTSRSQGSAESGRGLDEGETLLTGRAEDIEEVVSLILRASELRMRVVRLHNPLT